MIKTSREQTVIWTVLRRRGGHWQSLLFALRKPRKIVSSLPSSLPLFLFPALFVRARLDVDKNTTKAQFRLRAHFCSNYFIHLPPFATLFASLRYPQLLLASPTGEKEVIALKIKIRLIYAALRHSSKFLCEERRCMQHEQDCRDISMSADDKLAGSRSAEAFVKSGYETVFLRMLASAGSRETRNCGMRGCLLLLLRRVENTRQPSSRPAQPLPSASKVIIFFQ